MERSLVGSRVAAATSQRRVPTRCTCRRGSPLRSAPPSPGKPKSTARPEIRAPGWPQPSNNDNASQLSSRHSHRTTQRPKGPLRKSWLAGSPLC